MKVQRPQEGPKGGSRGPKEAPKGAQMDKMRQDVAKMRTTRDIQSVLGPWRADGTGVTPNSFAGQGAQEVPLLRVG